MNRTQIEYAHSRIDGLLSTKERDCRSRNTAPAHTITDAERADLVRSNKVKLSSDVKSISHYDKVTNLFDFSKYEWPAKVDEKAVAKEMRSLRAEAQVLKDHELGPLDVGGKPLRVVQWNQLVLGTPENQGR